ncbi:EFR1 family ferrodoxin [Gudongella sp. DL1XJH-153]|uniref:EFR1 family ferrodoxin n=1 Tax=Gudongella sp. DL1XJH-153 TaxID=3409804 RepID=UPI003BB54BAF
MIFYFSGTGNSLHIASTISQYLHDNLFFIPEELEKRSEILEHHFDSDDYLGFVFPVHAWGPPKIVLDFVDKLKLSGHSPYVFSVVSCAQEEGKTSEIFKRHLEKNGIRLSSSFTVIMPNNYILGNDVESQEDINMKLLMADKKVAEIFSILESKEEMFDLIPGKTPSLRTGIVNPFFRNFALNNKHFHVDENCDGCGICEKACPLHSIKVAAKPIWDGDCTMCLACINRCPTHAIQYDKKTADRGRYVHPDLLL